MKKMTVPVPPALLRNPVHLLSLGFGSGLAPRAPGTFGTLVAVPIYLLLRHVDPQLYWLFVLGSGMLGVWLCGVTARALGVHDHPGIVWDEITGYLLTMVAAPPGWLWVVLGFVLFRLFDIWKPWPIRQLDHGVRGGLGIMLDDVVAALYAWACLHAMLYVYRLW